jgi:hypothetical protein
MTNTDLKTNELTLRTAQIAPSLKCTDFAKVLSMLPLVPIQHRSPVKRRLKPSIAQGRVPSPTKKRKLDDLSRNLSKKPAIATPLRSILWTSSRKGSTTFTPSRVKLDVARLELEEQSDSDEETDPGPLPALNLARGHNLSYEGSASYAELDSDEDVDRLTDIPNIWHDIFSLCFTWQCHCLYQI